ncbi:MAG: hypothetical protein FJ088_10360, partial [Deltaproteobacteria bacterium]|nr:hypothetical protein [Deltaproteobacteria bacterium]
IIVAEAKDNAGFKVRTTRAFYFSFKYYPVDAANPKKGMVPDSIQVFLSKDFIDDGDHNPNKPDDLATILEKFIDTLDISSLIPSPAASQSGYDVYIKNISYGKSQVSLVPIDGGMNIFARIPNFHADVKLKGNCFLCPNFSGDISASEFNFKGTIYVSLDANKQVHAEMANVQVKIFDLDVDVDGILGWLVGWLIDIIVDEFASDIEQMLEDQIKDMFASTIEDLMKMLSLNMDFEIPELVPGMQPTSVFIMTEPSKLQFYPGGLDLWMDGTIYAAKKIYHTILGSIGRSQCMNINEGKFVLKKKSEVEFAGWFDLINEALYSIWAANVLNMTITEEMLGDSTDLTEYGITDLNVALDFYLPPILTDCNPESIVTAQVGDLYVDAKFKMFDVPITMGAFVSVELTAEFGTTVNEAGNQAISISLKELKTFEMEIVSVSEEFKGNEAALEQLIKDMLLPKLLETLQESASFSFELPELDMSSLDESLPPGIVLKLNLEQLYKDKGYVTGGGYLQ